MIVLDEDQIRRLKPGNKVTLDACPPHIEAGEYTVDKVQLWGQGGSVCLKELVVLNKNTGKLQNKHAFAINEFARLHARVEELTLKNRNYF